jgi:cyanate permease
MGKELERTLGKESISRSRFDVAAQQHLYYVAAMHYRYLIEALLFCTYAAFGLSWIALSPLAAEVHAEFQISATQFGAINTLVSSAKVIAPLLTGYLAAKIGTRWALMLGSTLIACSILSPLAQSFELFLVSRFLFGVGGAIVVTLLSPVVMRWFPKEELPLVNAFNNVAVNTGITITLYTTVPLAAEVGWRGALGVYGLISVGLAVAWLLAGREAPGAGAVAAGEGSYQEIWRLKETWLITTIFALSVALYLAFNTFLPTYYMESYHMEKQAASSYTGLFNLMGIPAAISGGILTRQLGVRKPFILAATSLMGVGALGMLWGGSPFWIQASAVLLGVGLFIGASPLFTLAMELPGMNPKKVGLLMGTVLSTTYLLSSLSPLLVGSIKDSTGSLVHGLAFWAILSLGGVVAAWFLPETGNIPEKLSGYGALSRFRSNG